MMQIVTKNMCLRRLGRIEGQIRGLRRMVEEERYCIDVLTQISAARAALKGVEQRILVDHLGACIDHAVAEDDTRDQRRKVAELIDVLGRVSR